MKSIIYIISLTLTAFTFGCQSSVESDSHGHTHDSAEAAGEEEHQQAEVHLSQKQVEALGLQVDTLTYKSLTGMVRANGRLEVPPQNEASVTAVLGGNITDIKVIEGDKVSKGQLLAILSHPNFIKIQSDYIKSWNELIYLEQEHNRQKRLYESEVGSGKAYQKIKSEYQATKGTVMGLEAEIALLGLSKAYIREGNIYQHIPLKSPIEGYVEQVDVKIGQFVEPNTELFALVNTHHIHADIMVFEKDIQKVDVGQTVNFTVETLPDMELTAEIYSVGKTFEQNPKAVHVHAEIKNKTGKLIPGMYIKANIRVKDSEVLALPLEGVFRESDDELIFLSSRKKDEWSFKAIKVKTGITYNGWVEIKPLEELPPNTQVVYNNAYYLVAEMKKGEAEHSH